MSNLTKAQDNIQKLSEASGYPAQEIHVIKNVVAKGTTDTELLYFLNVAKTAGLNPFLKQVWCYKDHKGNLLVFAGRDGFLAKAQEDERWNGMTSAPIYENDDYEVDVTNAKVKHICRSKDRGKVIGAYAIVKPKGVEFPTFVQVDINDYDKGHSTWKSNKPAMILKVAEAHALKKAHGISGVSVSYDFDFNTGVAVPRNQGDNEETGLLNELQEALELYQGEDKSDIQQMVGEKLESGEADETFLSEILEQIK